MAFFRGEEGSVKFENDGSTPAAITSTRSWSLTINKDTLDTTDHGSCCHRVVADAACAAACPCVVAPSPAPPSVQPQRRRRRPGELQPAVAERPAGEINSHTHQDGLNVETTALLCVCLLYPRCAIPFRHRPRSRRRIFHLFPNTTTAMLCCMAGRAKPPQIPSPFPAQVIAIGGCCLPRSEWQVS